MSYILFFLRVGGWPSFKKKRGGSGGKRGQMIYKREGQDPLGNHVM